MPELDDMKDLRQQRMVEASEAHGTTIAKTSEALGMGAPVTRWEPRCVVVDKDGCQIGIATYNGCFVALLQRDAGSPWYPTAWITPQAAAKMAELIEDDRVPAPR